VAGLFTPERGAPRERQAAGGFNGINQQLLVGTTVASVENASGLVDDDLAGTIFGDVGAGGQSGEVVYGGENAGFFVPA
jgi:hypothetical protein